MVSIKKMLACSTDKNVEHKMVARLETLRHIVRTLPNGGKILVLDTGAIIKPEAEAMLQALHSRSIGGIDAHLKILAEKGPEKFMSTFYVGYGHKSIGDCGTGTIFIEGVSMLVAKAIQDSQLYSGQEASTRYIDFSTQPFIDPLKTGETQKILERWRTFYLKSVRELPATLMQRFPMQEGEKEGVYKKAIAARTFDITRSFLPAGAATNLAWHNNLRQMADRLMLLRNHPLREVCGVAEAIEDALLEMFPSSFTKKRYEETEHYAEFWMTLHNYFSSRYAENFKLVRCDVDLEQLREAKDILAARPPKTELPKYLAECGTIQLEFLLDFGSFRDIHRHRAVTQRMPLVTTKHGFALWYLEELSPELRQEACDVLAQQECEIGALPATPEVKQYYIAMGYNLPNRLTGNLPALVYLVELRATRFVHPTLRIKARQIAAVLKDRFSDCGLTLHLDTDPDRFDVKRGEHDIVQKQ